MSVTLSTVILSSGVVSNNQVVLLTSALGISSFDEASSSEDSSVFILSKAL